MTENAWVTLAGTTSSVRTNSAKDVPEGSRFVAVDDHSGTEVGCWFPESWFDDPDVAAAQMAELWTAAAGGETVNSDDFGDELIFTCAAGSVRACTEGSYVRVVDGDAAEVVYYSVDEWVEDPVEVTGSILGAAIGLRARAEAVADAGAVLGDSDPSGPHPYIDDPTDPYEDGCYACGDPEGDWKHTSYPAEPAEEDPVDAAALAELTSSGRCTLPVPAGASVVEAAAALTAAARRLATAAGVAVVLTMRDDGLHVHAV